MLALSEYIYKQLHKSANADLVQNEIRVSKEVEVVNLCTCITSKNWLLWDKNDSKTLNFET